MDLSFGPEGDEFRAAIRRWLATHLPTDLSDDGGTPHGEDALFERRRAWNATMFDAGYAAIDWPTEFGGRDASVLAQRTVSAAMHDRTPGAEASVIKLAWSQMEQRVAETAVELLGLDALSGHWADRLTGSRSLTIAGGTTEVNKNIVGERVLGLPRESKVGG